MKFIYNEKDQLSKVSDTYSRTYEYTYNKFGYLESVSDFVGRTLLFEYSSEGDLILVTFMPKKGSSTKNSGTSKV
jgi:YD repeat-containing protein